MPTSKVWASPLPVGTPVMAHPDGAGRVRSSKVASWIVASWIAGTVRASKRGEYSPIIYLIETNSIDPEGYAVTHWVGMRNVRPVDTDNPEKLMEWLDG